MEVLSQYEFQPNSRNGTQFLTMMIHIPATAITFGLNAWNDVNKKKIHIPVRYIFHITKPSAPASISQSRSVQSLWSTEILVYRSHCG